MGRKHVILLALGGLLAAGCDPAAVVGDAAGGPQPPEGWESLEGEDASMRLYYQFVDDGGNVRFVERLAEVPERWRANVGFLKLDVPPPLSPAEAQGVRDARYAASGAPRRATRTAGGAPAALAARPQIILYSADWCGACRKAKRYLSARGIDYEERNVDQPEIKEELLRKTGRRSVPVIDVGGRILTGFSPRSYDELVGSA